MISDQQPTGEYDRCCTVRDKGIFIEILQLDEMVTEKVRKFSGEKRFLIRYLNLYLCHRHDILELLILNIDLYKVNFHFLLNH